MTQTSNLYPEEVGDSFLNRYWSRRRPSTPDLGALRAGGRLSQMDRRDWVVRRHPVSVSW